MNYYNKFYVWDLSGSENKEKDKNLCIQIIFKSPYRIVIAP